MDAIQQHMLDTYRAARHGESPPPLPGRYDVAVVRSLRDHHRFTRVLAGRPVHPVRSGLRTTVSRVLHREGREGHEGPHRG